MSFLPAIKDRAAHVLKTVLYTFLLAFFSVGTLQFEALHGLFHPHNEIVHSEFEEADGCHRTIYHEVVEKGCGHQSHIVAWDKCELCDLIFQTCQVVLQDFENSSIEFFAENFFFSSTDIASIESYVDSARAPPAL